MSKDASLVEKKLKKILDSHEYSELDIYRDPENWRTMTSSERELLGKLFIMQGQDLLDRGEKSALKSFDLAVKAAPKSPTIFFEKGLAYSTQNNIRCLNSACKAFDKATRLEPGFFDAWCQWAHALIIVGEMKSEGEFFVEAHEKFQVAEKCYPRNAKKGKPEFYWHWGHCWHLMGKLSGEAIDISNALEKYKKAESCGANISEFWNDYGNALGEQACLLGMDNLFGEVVEKFRKSVNTNLKDFEGWFGLACSYMRVYETTLDDDDFDLANEAFVCASEIDPKSIMLWLCWGQLFLVVGKVQRDRDLLYESTIKFEEANLCETNNSLVLCRWAESLMCLGAIQEDIQLIRQAEEKIIQSMKNDPDNAEIWYFYGRVLIEKGRYFGDVTFYFEAIEKYQHGFSLNKALKLFHYGIAISFYEVSVLTGDQDALKQSLKHFHELSQEESDLPAQFWVDWGNALYKYGDETHQKHYIEASLSKYEHAISILGEDLKKDPLIVSCVYHYGCALDTLGDMYDDPAFYEKAIQLLGHVLQYDPGFAHARYNLALTLAHLGELISDITCLEKSSDHFETLLNDDPEDENGWNDWGVTLLNMANLVRDPSMPEYADRLYVMAESKFQHAIALGNNHAYYNLAGYYSNIGNYNAAMEFLQKAEHANCLPSVDEMMHDEWLEPLRHTDEFRTFISKFMREH
jgi:tetratricopeptide (TPR) repeat protein